VLELLAFSIMWGNGKLCSVHTIKVKVLLHAVAKGVQSASHPTCFTLRKHPSINNWVAVWKGPKAILDTLEGGESYFLPLLAIGLLPYPACNIAIVQQNDFDPSSDNMEILIIGNWRRVFARLGVLLFTREELRHWNG